MKKFLKTYGPMLLMMGAQALDAERERVDATPNVPAWERSLIDAAEPALVKLAATHAAKFLGDAAAPVA